MRALCIGLISLSLAACGGGSGGGTPPAGGVQAQIHFPPPVSMTDAVTLAVRGVAPGASAVSVNGVAAASTDGFATWTATVTLSPGLNDVLVSTTDGAGAVNPSAASARVLQDPDATMTGSIGAGESFDTVQDAYLDRANGRLLVTESGAFLQPGDSRLFALPLEAGNRLVLSSDATVGGGAPTQLEAAHGLCFDTAGGSIFITDRELDQIIRVDPGTGLRSIVTDGTVGSPAFESPEDVEFIPAQNRLVWIDNSPSGSARIMAFDLSGGVRIVLSDDTNSGPALDGVDNLKFDPVGNRLLSLADDVTGQLIDINLTTGDRVVIADGSTGTGGPAGFPGPTGIGLDSANNRIFTHLRNPNVTVFVDLATGNRTVVSEPGVRGNGPAVVGVQSTEYDDAKHVGYVLDPSIDAIFAIDGVTGERVIFSK